MTFGLCIERRFAFSIAGVCGALLEISLFPLKFLLWLLGSLLAGGGRLSSSDFLGT